MIDPNHPPGDKTVKHSGYEKITEPNRLTFWKKIPYTVTNVVFGLHSTVNNIWSRPKYRETSPNIFEYNSR